ncbi:unnamed protein product [Chrysoparadoxa australica]
MLLGIGKRLPGMSKQLPPALRRSLSSFAARRLDHEVMHGPHIPVVSPLHLPADDFDADVLVIGSGIAGASAALKAASQGMHVVMLSAAQELKDCNSYWAQGGIIYKALDDHPSLLAKDVHIAGAGICNNKAVMKLANDGPRRVEEILMDVAQVPFDREEDGELSLCLEASHNRARIIHWKDQTGKAITDCVQREAARHPNITVLTGSAAVDLAVTQGLSQQRRCVGAHVLVNGSFQTISAPATVLATGGLGEIYAHTSNPESARGDGFAMALRAGAAMGNMEYVQFHPTTLHLEGQRSFLLTEALRGEGARLIDDNGRAFAKDYHEAGELAPRDVVSRMIVSEMEKQGKTHMYLDITHRDGEWLANRFPGIYEHCLAQGLDIRTDPLPVVPAAHYFCGGVVTNLQGRTSVPGLFAAGEVACTGLHGGNRLASTSLLEGLVWGCSIAEHLNESRGGERRLTKMREKCAYASVIPFDHRGSSEIDPDAMSDAWSTLKQTMWGNVGVIRTTGSLRSARHQLESELRPHVEEMYQSSRLCVETVALRNGADTGAMIATAAAGNRSSIGAHFVRDGAEELCMEASG